MLTRMAVKCVVSAVTIIELLGAQSEAHIFMAWWFNIACNKNLPKKNSRPTADILTDLHACGSTILMARTCTFNDTRFNHNSLTANWNMCLKTLARYAKFSSVARRSSYLLYQSAERLISARHGQTTNRGDTTGGESTLTVSRGQQRYDHEFEQQLNPNSVRTTAPGGAAVVVPPGSQATNRLVPNPLRKDNNAGLFELADDSSGMASFLDFNLDFGSPPDLESNFWTGDPPESGSWSLMPSMDHQFETFPPRFGF